MSRFLDLSRGGDPVGFAAQELYQGELGLALSHPGSRVAGGLDFLEVWPGTPL